MTIDLDSTVCETLGLVKGGAQRHNYAGCKAITIRQHQSLRNLIEAMPETAWTSPTPAVSGS